ncbi:hypothetical protein MHF_0236 [Mycoplasma haemofelis Ohio2]|uniref:Lipoprotein n=1 Tax=Mycoplasma haemofelis (strain Ohio2) TaxID=859194 RepID=F6FGE1_MYCHI|nr:hypothetical protein MHF_0236 [Mycoplasma haemofelis Ohio2]
MTTKTLGFGALGAAGAASACGGGYLLMKEKTIGDRVSKSGLVLIKSGDSKAWRLASKHLKLSDKNLVTDLSRFDAEIKQDSIDLDKAKVALEKWCLEATGKDLSEKNIEDYLDKVKSRCVVAPADIRAKLEREGKTLVTNWGNKFDSFKSKTQDHTTIKEDLKVHDNSISKEVSNPNGDKDKYLAALEKWCSSGLKVKIEDDNYDGTYPKVVDRCTQG